MGLRWEKSTDGRDLWIAMNNGWRLEVEQDSDGDWVWRASNWDEMWGIHEVMGVEATDEEAHDAAYNWSQRE